MDNGKHRFAALGWIAEPLDERFQQIHDAYQAAADDLSTDEPMTTAEAHLWEIHGVLTLIRCEGGMTMAEELAETTVRVRKDKRIDREQGLAVLMESTVVLAGYLERLQSGLSDLPMVLLPQLNELRALRDESLFSEGVLFNPDLSPADAELPAAEPAEDGAKTLSRQRRQFEKALSGWLRDETEESMQELVDIADSLARGLEHPVDRRLWWIAAQVMRGCIGGVIDSNITLRRLLARLHLYLKRLDDKGQKDTSTERADGLARGLLFQAALAERGHPDVDRLNDTLKIRELVPSRQALELARGSVTGRDRSVFLSLKQAMGEELERIKDELDLSTRTGKTEDGDTLVGTLKGIAGTLELAGLKLLSQRISDRAEAIDDDAETDREALAEDILRVEDALEELVAGLGQVTEADDSEEISAEGVPAFELRRVRNRVFSEALVGLMKMEEALLRFLDGRDDPQAMKSALAELEHITGALLVTRTEGAGAVEALRAWVADELAEEQDEGRMRVMAEAVTALERFLAARRDGLSEAQMYLDLTRERIAELTGKTVNELVSQSAETASEPAEDAAESGLQATADEPETPETPETPESTDLAPEAAPAPVEESAEDPVEETATDAEDQIEAGETAAEPADEEAGEEADEVADRVADEAAAEAADRETGSEPVAIDAEMLAIFLEEFDEVSGTLQEQTPVWLAQTDNTDALTEIRRAFHTLKGSGRMVGAEEIGHFAWAQEDLLNRVLEDQTEADRDVRYLTRLAVAMLPALRQRLTGEDSPLSADGVSAFRQAAEGRVADQAVDREALIAQLPETLSAVLTEPVIESPAESAAEAEEAADDTLVNLIRSEVGQHLGTLQQLAEQAERSLQRARASSQDVIAAHTIAGALALAPVDNEARVAHELENLLQALSEDNQRLSTETLGALVEANALFAERLAQLEGGADGPLPDTSGLLERIKTERKRVETQAAEVEQAEEEVAEAAATEADQVVDQPVEAAPETATEPETVTETTDEPVAEETPEPETAAEPEPEPEPEPEIDEIAALFLSEAKDILERSDGLLHAWQDSLNDRQLISGLQRELHTLKGSARMAGYSDVGGLAHNMESVLEAVAENQRPATTELVDVIQLGYDHMDGLISRLSDGQQVDVEGSLKAFERAVTGLEHAAAAPADTTAGDADERTDKAAEDRGAVLQRAVRVAPETLDELVNHAGEISIYRSRMEQMMSDFRFNLSEMDETLDRLREQLRKLEIETETQILSRHQDELSDRSSDFDPLELDQYSNIQQLSRSLSESMADMSSLQEMLDDAARQSETLMLQQSRVTTDLQEGLMRTRMVPFRTLSPRLRRVVRQAAEETGRSARLEMVLEGSGGELDRNVLERITPPLEHMLRNAVAHGIEDPKQRRRAGKDDEGRITVTVESEATELVIRVRDDGAGIDLDAVRQRGIERGLIDADAEHSTDELYNLVFESGFTTATEVTDLSGRGVGMDVVSNEVKQIGGSIDVRSEAGVGTTFNIRIPFTLAVMPVIFMRVGERQFALPLASVRGVARLPVGDYRAKLEQEQPHFEFAGDAYPIIELEPQLGFEPEPLGEENISLLMLRAGEQQAAIRVPELGKHREVVIKPVGPQVNSIPGILGGTITGDGMVVLILDIGPLARRALSQQRQPEKAPAQQETEIKRAPLVMVVDDSITMRKITSRVLEHQNLEVVTARDGLDAIEHMMDRVPDAILLDIEMPRMDGFELAEHVRSDPRLRDIPMMMITSRSGEKHRNRAQEVGVNRYLSKPYQESELLRNVRALLAENEVDE